MLGSARLMLTEGRVGFAASMPMVRYGPAVLGHWYFPAAGIHRLRGFAFRFCTDFGAVPSR